MKKVFFGAICSLAILTACNAPQKSEPISGLKRTDFQTEIKGKQTDLYTLTNKNGMEVCITNFGARLVSIMVPDKNGNMQDVLVGFTNITDYSTKPSDFGASIGQYANRIAGGMITLDGVTYDLPKNNFGHCLHGGCTLEPAPLGWQYHVFDVEKVSDNQIVLVTTSPDGEAGFPGNVVSKTSYTLTDDNAIDIEWTATTDKKTVINLTNHAYFNLNGNPQMPILNHQLMLNADYYTPVDSTFMTTGEIAPVAGTPMDFTAFKEIGKEINNYDFDQLKNGNGYDHNWVLNTKGDDTKVCATLKSPVTGIVLDVYTNEPGIQIYTGNFLDGTTNGKDGKSINQRTAICLETQKYPDTPNKSHLEGWPSATLEPGQKYYSHCVYKFSVQK